MTGFDVEGFGMATFEVTADDAAAWMRRYFGAWRSNDAAEVAALFADDAVYAVSPFADPWRGRDTIVARWTAGNGRLLRSDFQVLAERGDTACVHWSTLIDIGADDGTLLEQDGILTLRFDADGQCTEHREWFFERSIPSGRN